VRDFTVAVPFVTKKQHPPVAFRELIESGTHCIAALAGENRFVGELRRATGGQLLRLRSEQPQPPLGCAPVVAQQVVRDGSHPSARVIGHRTSLIQFHEYLLGDVFREICVPGEAMQIAEQRRELLVEKSPEESVE
jgi:hypothetical protein